MLPVPEKDLIADERWALVGRVVSSRGFTRAAQLRELLQYLAAKAIVSPSEDPSEQEIGSRVLGRRPDYDTQADNIVRVQIRHLRQKLDDYFASEGRHESTVIVIPKGSRVPRFEQRPQPVQQKAPDSPLRPSLGSPWWILGIAALALAAFAVGRYSSDWNRPRPEKTEFPDNPVWARLFLKNQPTAIVLADSNLAVVSDLLGVSVPLKDYISGSPRKLIDALPDDKFKSALLTMSTRQYTSFADASLSSKLFCIGHELGANVTVRYARHMNIRDFNAGNFIVLGSKRGVPWVESLEPEMNFILARIGKEWRFGFLNKHPLKGEPESYSSVIPREGPYEAYATLSMLPTLTRNGTFLLVDGVSMEATEAAGEFCMSGEFAKFLDKTFRASSPAALPYFEVLVKTTAVYGSPHKVEVIAWRKRPNP